MKNSTDYREWPNTNQIASGKAGAAQKLSVIDGAGPLMAAPMTQPKTQPSVPALADASEIWLDVSRTLWRIYRCKLTGIDRVELGYALTLLQLEPTRVRFVARDYMFSTFRLLPREASTRLMQDVASAWDHGDMGGVRRRALLLLISSMTTASPVPRWREGRKPRPIYINVSTHPLHNTAAFARFAKKTRATIIALVHDMIPLDHPEFVPSNWVKLQTDRVVTINKCVHGVISNSFATTRALARYIREAPVLTAPLGVRTAEPSPLPPLGAPYFVCIGTIEPRKNHLLLLHCWREIVRRWKKAAPHLVLVGARGWENEQVVDILERCCEIRGIVHEVGMVPDGTLATWLNHAQALLMPSFVEGYGLPVVEALSLGTPVICSDIEAHREIAGEVAEFIHPLDGAGWIKAIEDYAWWPEGARAEQVRRLEAWDPPAWDQHLGAVLTFADSINRQREGESTLAPGQSRLPRGLLPEPPQATVVVRP